MSQRRAKPRRLELRERDESAVDGGVAEGDGRGRSAVLADDEIAHNALKAVRADDDVRLVRRAVRERDDEAAWGSGRVRDGCAALAEVRSGRVDEAYEGVEEGGAAHISLLEGGQKGDRREGVPVHADRCVFRHGLILYTHEFNMNRAGKALRDAHVVDQLMVPEAGVHEHAFGAVVAGGQLLKHRVEEAKCLEGPNGIRTC